MHRLIAAALAAALVLSFASPAFAAKGGKHAAILATATLSASPNPATAGSTVRVEGCGFTFPTSWMPPVQLDVIAPDGSIESWGLGLFPDGCIAGTNITPVQVGIYTLNALQGGTIVGTLQLIVSS